MCFEETLAGYPNCREGHSGLVCGLCFPDWRQVDGFCESCVGEQSVAKWPEANRAALSAFLAIIALALGLVGLWWLLIGEALTLRMQALFVKNGSELKVEDVRDKSKTEPGVFALVLALIAFFAEPLKLVTESLQIVSSFRETTRVEWPVTYTRFVGRLSIVNFNFLHLPKSACASPPTDVYKEFDGITLAVTAFCLVITVAWVLGLLLNAIVLRRDAVLVAIYNRKTWAKLLLLLQLAYAPLAENIIGVFACREIDGEWWLLGHVDKQCYTPEHRHYTSLGAFWAAIYVAGTPALFLATLVYYRIPAAAKYLGQLALLRQTVDIAWQRGVKMPEVNTSILTLSNITDDHIDALYNGLVRRSSRVAADGLEDALTGEAAADEEEEYEEDKDAKTSADKAGTPEDKRQRRLKAIMLWGSKHVHVTNYTWNELPEADDPRRPGSFHACEPLFHHYYPACWYYKLFETAVKLVLTSVLLFIAPGSSQQILAAVLISFGVLVVYLRLLPFAIKPVRRVAYNCNLCIFLLLLLAFSIKSGVQVGGTAKRSDLFYSVTIGCVIYALFAVPIGVISNSGFMMFVRHHAQHKLHHNTSHLHQTGHHATHEGDTRRTSLTQHLAEEHASEQHAASV